MITKQKDYMHSVRIAYENWVDAERFSQLMELFKAYPCNIQSLAFFTASTHAPLTLEELTRRVNIIKERMAVARKAGFSVGINILATIGHHEEDLSNTLGNKFFRMTGVDGRICRGSYCMNDTRLLENHVAPVYKILAEAQPDFIWVDDDVRYGHMPIGFGCFCQGCIDKFNLINGTSHTRKSLVQALNGGCLDTRRAWLSHNSEAIKGLFRVIRKSVHSVNDQITLGFMTGERYMEGYDFPGYADALSADGKSEIMWRPGGGAYTDYTFDDIVEKSEQVGRQAAFLPEYVSMIQYEIENFPYQSIKKTPTSTALEAAWSMASGCTGAAFNILPSESGEPIRTIIPHLKAIDKLSGFYKLLEEKIAGKQPAGICAAWRPDCQLSVPGERFTKDTGEMFANFSREFFDFGLPQCYDPKNACVSVARGAGTAHWSQEELQDLLSGGVYMDAEALDHFNARGFETLTGFRTEKSVPVDAREFFLEHPLNEGLLGGLRNCRQAFNPGDSVALTPAAEGAQALTRLADYSEATLAECALGLYENPRGGRIAVGGYYPFTWVSDYYKTIQLKRLMVKLSGETLPSYVDSYCRIRNHTFLTGSGCIVALLNPTNETLENVRVAIKTDSGSAMCYCMDGSACRLERTATEGGYGIFTAERIPAYEMVVIETL